MGASQSINYPTENDIVNIFRETDEVTILEDPKGFSESSTDSDIDIQLKRNDLIQRYLNNLNKRLETSLKIYLMLDNYDNKNEIIIRDLDKKYKIQNEEIKSLYENKDKIKSIIENKRKSTNKNLKNKNVLNLVNILLIITLITIISIIVKKKIFLKI